MINFICVYRTGKIYTPEYVRRLAQSIAENMEVEHTFTVLTDDVSAFSEWLHANPNPGQYKDVQLLAHNWPGYWSKIELFRPGLLMHGMFFVYLDLDTIPRKNLTSILDRIRLRTTPLRFYMLRDWLAPDHFNSSVMCWVSGYRTHLYTQFMPNAEAYMREYRKYPEKWGDQSFISNNLGFLPTSLQDEFPNEFVSFKVGTIAEKTAASVVCFHGNPRPHSVEWNPIAPFGDQ